MDATTESLTTGSLTIAELVPLAAAKYPERRAASYKRNGAWDEVTYAQLGQIVQEIGLGLIAIGLRPGQRLGILAATRPEWSYVDMAAAAAGAVIVPIYPTSSPEECHYILEDAAVSVVVCENPEQVQKILSVAARLPLLHRIVVIDAPTDPPLPDTIALTELRERGRTRQSHELEARAGAVRPSDPFTIIYTSGTTGPPKGCVLSHANYRATIDMVVAIKQLDRETVSYLHLPLAHAFALLIQLAVFDVGASLIYSGGEARQIVTELMEAKPTSLPTVPRIFEKIYAVALAEVQALPAIDQAQVRAGIANGVQVRERMSRGEQIPEHLRESFERADRVLFSKVRSYFGGRLRQAITGAAPIAPEILGFFWAAGIPVLECYGMTETATAATASTLEHHRLGTVGRALPGVQLQIAGDGELLVKGPNIFQGYNNNADESFGAIRDGWLHTGDLGAIDEDGFLTITGRKKDIIITAGGKNLAPANIENDLRQSRWISQAVVHGDRRPYPVVLITLDEEAIFGYAESHGLAQGLDALARDPSVHALIERELDRVNAKYARAVQIKRFAILDRELSEEGGELTPTLKVKRRVVNEKYAALFDSLYQASLG